MQIQIILRTLQGHMQLVAKKDKHNLDKHKVIFQAQECTRRLQRIPEKHSQLDLSNRKNIIRILVQVNTMPMIKLLKIKPEHMLLDQKKDKHNLDKINKMIFQVQECMKNNQQILVKHLQYQENKLKSTTKILAPEHTMQAQRR